MLAAGQAKRYGGCKPLAPIGLHGEAVIDLTASDAVAAGFGEVVLVLGPSTGPAIEYHVRRTWPGHVPVRFSYQSDPLGTAHAVLCARDQVGDRPFAVVNGDDVYGADAFGVLDAHFANADRAAEHALVAFDLADSVVGANPVTRGTVRAGDDGLLTGIDERRQVRAAGDGTFATGDGRQPATLDPTTAVSVNLWGFRSAVWPVLVDAVAATHPHLAGTATSRGRTGAGAAADRAPAGADQSGGSEVLLPEVIGTMVANGDGGGPVRVLRGPGRCVGVTHADDLPVVRAVLAAMVGAGQRPEWPWAPAG